MTAVETYIDILQEYKHLGSDLGDQANKVLAEFSDKQYMSTYMVYDNFKRKIDYKNTHKRVKRLETLQFIEPVKVEEARHGAKYYRITEAGMFQLFLIRDVWRSSSLRDQLPMMLETHAHYLIFETLVYPYFKKETLPSLPALKSFEDDPKASLEFLHGIVYEITRAIYQYIRNCCMEIYQYITTLLNYRKDSDHTMGERIMLDLRLEYLDNYIILEKNQLVMKILLWFRTYKGPTRMDALAILAQDDKFMDIAEDLHKDFDKGFKIAMDIRMGNRS
jgi:hypothetical protein